MNKLLIFILILWTVAASLVIHSQLELSAIEREINAQRNANYPIA